MWFNSRSIRASWFLAVEIVLSTMSPITLTIMAADAAPAAKHNTLTKEEIADGWILLFDGETMFGWEPGSKADWKVTEGQIGVTTGEAGLLHTTCEFADYRLKVDFRAPQETNSGIFLRTPAVPKDPKSDCYELNIADPKISPFPTGSFVGRKKGTADAKPGEWHSYDLTVEGGRFIVQLDGKQVIDYEDAKSLPRGFIGLQYNMGAAQFRNVKLKPLAQKSLFNGQDLTGWKPFVGEKQKSVITVAKPGEFNIKNGPGQLESEVQFADFTLQLDVFSNGKSLNSGVFFRSIPGEFQNGYECQIQNGFKDDDRTKPADCGTGGIYRRQNARKVVSNDFEWFTMTLCTNGPHVAAWVNGYQVSDWTDTRSAHNNPRNGTKVEPGTLIIQGHDPTTDLSFRNLRAVELPKK